MAEDKTYLDVVQWHESRRGKKFTTYLGSATEDKGKIYINLLALPIPDSEGQIRIVVQEKYKRDGDRGGSRKSESSGRTRSDDDDEIPF